MADDWIKMRSNLWDHPKIVRLVSAICPDGVRDASLKCRVIGALFRTWSIADRHSDNGVLSGYDAQALNADIGIEGWAESLQHVGWITIETQSITIQRFEEHNSESAKKRAEEARRKREARKTSALCPENKGQMSKNDGTRGEERRVYIESNRSRIESNRSVSPIGYSQFGLMLADKLAPKKSLDLQFVALVGRAIDERKITEALAQSALVGCETAKNRIAMFRSSLAGNVKAAGGDLESILQSLTTGGDDDQAS